MVPPRGGVFLGRSGVPPPAAAAEYRMQAGDPDPRAPPAGGSAASRPGASAVPARGVLAAGPQAGAPSVGVAAGQVGGRGWR